MIPSIFALIVLAVGLILLHFGIKQLGASLSNITITPTPFVEAAGGAATK